MKSFKPDTDPSPSTDGRSGKPITLRATLIGVAFAAFFCAVTPYNDYKIAATYISGTQFPVGALFVLLICAAVINPILHWLRPKLVFSRAELLTIWVLILVPSGIASSGLMRYFLPQIAAPHYYSNRTNDWEHKVWGGIPEWLKMHDQSAADAFFKGYPRGQEHIPWDAWTAPLFFWGIVAVLFLIATFCITNLLRRQWVENERFSFPLVTLPLLLAEEPERGSKWNALLRNPLLWIGFLVTTLFHTARGLHQLYPSIPEIPFYWNLMDFLTVRPWNGIGPIEIYLYPMVIGFAFLLPAEVSFSLWFFHFVYKSEMLVGVMYNLPLPGPTTSYGYKTFHSLEAFGGALALFGWTLWSARRHLRGFWRTALGKGDGEPDGNEMLSYRATLVGLIISYGGIALWLGVAKVPPVLILLSLLVMTITTTTVSWMVTQAGMIFMASPYSSVDLATEVFGTGILPISPTYTMLRWEHIFLYDTREMLAPSLLMGAKAGNTGEIPLRSLFRAMVLSLVVGIGVSLFASLYLPYYNGGGLSLQNPFMYGYAPQHSLSFLGSIANVPRPPNTFALLHIAGGFIGVLGLLVARATTSFGLHPVGFLVASVYSIHVLWASILIGWACKSVTIRYSGMGGYVKLLPFFLGFILADVVNSMVWVVIGALTGSGYQLLPG